MMINLYDLIKQEESDYLEFKREYHENKACLVHDILCLANSLAESDRYLVFGIDDVGQVVGVEADPKRLNQAGLIDCLRSKQLNSLPSIKMTSIKIDEHVLDIVIIKNISEKPYFLNNDFREGKVTVRAGVIYTRDGDTNTPIDKSASEVKIGKMFQERFGILDDPLKRFSKYLKDKDNWKYGHTENDSLIFYYQPFPEFTIITNPNKYMEEYSEPWHLSFPDMKASRDQLLVKYHGTILETVYIVWCDGARFVTVMPSVYHVGTSNIESFYYVVGSIEYLIKEMIAFVYPDCSRVSIDHIFSYFGSDSEAQIILAEDFKSGNPSKNTYFLFDEIDKSQYQISSNGRIKLRTILR